MAEPTVDQIMSRWSDDKRGQHPATPAQPGPYIGPAATPNLAISLSDQHIPFQDRKVEKQIFRMLADYQPDDVIVNGDLVDFYSISSFVKDPGRKNGIQHEVDEAIRYLSRIRSTCPNTRIHYNLGNHEERLKRYLSSNAAALHSLRCLQFADLFQLDESEVILHGPEGFRLNRSLLVKHGSKVSKHAGGTARMEFESHLISGLTGHTHRLGRYDVRGVRGDYCWVEQGCLCSLNPEYLSGTPNWHHGFAMIEYSAHRFNMREVRITGRKLVIGSEDYSQNSRSSGA